MSVVIAAAGLVCPAGLGLAESAAGARARLSVLREIDWCDRRQEPFIVGVVPDQGLPALAPAAAAAPLQAREGRMLRLAHAALADLYAGLPADLPAPPLFLGLPEHHTTRPIDPDRFLKALASQAGACFDPSLSIAAPRGRASGLMALSQAAARIAAGEAGLILVGGLDSFVDMHVLATLDEAGRVRGETVSDGFSPAEGAAFLLVASESVTRSYGLPVLARIAATGSGFEPGHLYADEPYLGEGLAGVVSAFIQHNAIISGMGVGVLPLYSAIEGLRNGTLVRILPQYRSQELNLYAIYPSRQYLDAKIKTWVEYLRGSLPEILAAHQAELAAYELSGTLGGARLAN